MLIGMKPVTQTKFYDPENGTKGNCLRAAVASILELDIDSVPAFEEMDASEWFDNLIAFIKSQGRVFDQTGSDEVPEGYAIANGMSPRGVRHSVIYKDGALVHDPHPSRLGILAVNQYWTFAESRPQTAPVHHGQDTVEAS